MTLKKILCLVLTLLLAVLCVASCTPQEQTPQQTTLNKIEIDPSSIATD